MRRPALGMGILLMAVLLLLPGGLSAQVAVGGGAGVTFTNFGGDDAGDEDFDGRTGFYVGGSLGIPLTSMVGIGTGAYYVQKGADFAGLDAGVELAYLEIPLLLQVVPTQPDRPVAVSIFLGPNLGFNLSCDEEGSDCSDNAKSVEFGLLAGAGVSFGLGEQASFSVNGGLDLGLTSISENDDEDIKNRAYFLGIGISWPVGG